MHVQLNDIKDGTRAIDIHNPQFYLLVLTNSSKLFNGNTLEYRSVRLDLVGSKVALLDALIVRSGSPDDVEEPQQHLKRDLQAASHTCAVLHIIIE